MTQHQNDPQHSSAQKSTSQRAQEQGEVVKQELEVKGNQLVERFKEIVEEGNARRVIIRREGHTVMEFPLTVGVGGAAAAVMMSPALAALGAIGAMLTDVKVIVERTRPEGSEAGEAQTGPTPPRA